MDGSLIWSAFPFKRLVAGDYPAGDRGAIPCASIVARASREQ
jgi:hypothetical protein